MSDYWLQHEALALCSEIEPTCASFGCHVALTGGLIYRTGPRKDCDLIFYRHAPAVPIQRKEFVAALVERHGLAVTSDNGIQRVAKAMRGERIVDLFFPEDSRWESTGKISG